MSEVVEERQRLGALFVDQPDLEHARDRVRRSPFPHDLSLQEEEVAVARGGLHVDGDDGSRVVGDGRDGEAEGSCQSAQVREVRLEAAAQVPVDRLLVHGDATRERRDLHSLEEPSEPLRELQWIPPNESWHGEVTLA